MNYLLRIVVACLICGAMAFAEEWKSTTLNCALDLPAGWEADPEAPTEFASADGQTQLALLVSTNAGFQAVNPLFVKTFEHTLRMADGLNISTRELEHGGLPACEATYDVVLDDEPVRAITRVIIAEGRIYNLQAISFSGDVTTNADVKKLFASFRFLPSLEDPITSKESTGRFSNRNLELLLVIVVIALLFGFKYLFRRKR